MKKKILVVEDDVEISNNLKKAIEGEGYLVDLARNGKIALEILQSTSDLPALILLDLMMPIMDGFEFRRRQLLVPAFSTIPVVIMTAGGSVEAKASSLGARGFVKKPIELDDLFRVLSEGCA